MKREKEVKDIYDKVFSELSDEELSEYGSYFIDEDDEE